VCGRAHGGQSPCRLARRGGSPGVYEHSKGKEMDLGSPGTLGTGQEARWWGGGPDTLKQQAQGRSVLGKGLGVETPAVIKSGWEEVCRE
jgi:hypothetical protein